MRRLVPSCVAIGAYAWWATGVAPFTWASYVLVGVVGVIIVALYAREGLVSTRRTDVTAYFAQRSRDVTWRTTTPWLVVLVAAVAIEGVGLALGGNSQHVPTLSDALDRLLVWHVARWALFCWWVGVAAWPVVRLHRWRDSVVT